MRIVAALLVSLIVFLSAGQEFLHTHDDVRDHDSRCLAYQIHSSLSMALAVVAPFLFAGFLFVVRFDPVDRIPSSFTLLPASPRAPPFNS